jgi:hypothetical protein
MNKKNIDVEGLVKFCKLAKLPFKVTISNYTQKIESVILLAKQMEDHKSTRFFASAQMVKKDVKNKPLPDCPKEFSKFNDFNIRDEFFIDEIWAVDISSAYATMLHNAGYISDKTFDFIQKLPKLERLASIGMLASNKKEFIFNKEGELEDIQEIVSPTENYFYFAVQETARVMQEAKEIAFNNDIDDYLFTWVDCIYFKNPEKIQIVTDYFDSINVKYKVSKYSQFLVTRKRKHFSVSFFDDKEKKKIFSVPLPSEKIRKQLEHYLLNIKK